MISDQGPEQVLESHGDSIITTKADGCVKLDVNQDHEVAGWEAISVPGLLSKAVQAAPDVPALAVKRQDQWVKWTYKEYLQVRFRFLKMRAKRAIFCEVRRSDFSTSDITFEKFVKSKLYVISRKNSQYKSERIVFTNFF